MVYNIVFYSSCYWNIDGFVARATLYMICSPCTRIIIMRCTDLFIRRHTANGVIVFYIILSVPSACSTALYALY